jgi:hypothetical protein
MTQTDRRAQVVAALSSLTVIGGTPPALLVPVVDGSNPRMARIVDWLPLDRLVDTLLAILDAPAVPAGQAPATDQTALTDAERTMLTYALDQAQERIWSEDGFTDEDQAAVTSLRRLATPSAVVVRRATDETAGEVCGCGHGRAYHDFEYGGPRCRLCPERGEWKWNHAFTAAGAQQLVCKCPAEICQCGHHQAQQPKADRP